MALAIGVTAGLVGGYFGNVTRNATEWLFNLVMTFPGLITLIVLMPLTRGDYRWTMLIYGVLLAPGTYRIVRNLVVAVKNELYVDAARVSGLSDLRILGRHVLFVIRGPVITNTAFLMGTAIGVQSGLAFLGVGSKEVPSFGLMIASGFGNLYLVPLQFVWPSILLGLLTGSMVLLGNSVRDAFELGRPKPQKLAAPPVAVGAQLSDGVASSTAPSTDGGAGGGTAGPLLSVHDLGVAFPAGDDLREVVKGVSLTVGPGEVVGLVGESGSGKSQTAFSVLGVLAPEARITRGSIRLDGRELIGLSDAELRPLRGRVVSYIPQEPMSNLDPCFTVGSQLTERVRRTLGAARGDERRTVLELLERVEIPDPARVFASYPHQISGGMAQRVLIAGAVACRPRLLIADEPTTALDVTVQAEILDLLRGLQKDFDMAILLVTHNFGVVADLCDRLVVMRDGEVVESGSTREVFAAPRHAYTRSLLGSILDEDYFDVDVLAKSVGAGR
ncbi:dipeptide/oligopeptide/nickel ABC transporter permease/ATP-binding protein [Microlunatus flavus]|uniref:Peptide/nickel transport system permease protein n=1 Tax=Microlunatus flavus TaxID=1036181 RepID=A0A1H9A837_9ACTN|nr:dipeptide/oligopeptide/nickel ABC transporter permease/ATP-binding protein [Microlunatus flavus]SEP72691.1 peptide/nickel transport system permease protein [Microlunatus flavus]